MQMRQPFIQVCLNASLAKLCMSNMKTPGGGGGGGSREWGRADREDMIEIGDHEDGADAFARGRAGHANEEVHGCIPQPLHAPIQLPILQSQVTAKLTGSCSCCLKTMLPPSTASASTQKP